MILEIGNPTEREGVITIDAQPGGTYGCKVPPLPVAIARHRGEFVLVEAYHFWEHLYHWEAVQLADELYELLKPGGMLVLELPNLIHCCEFVAGVKEIPQKDDAEGDPDPRFLLWGIYGAQDDPRHAGNVYQAHKFGYTPATIMAQLVKAGFRSVMIVQPERGQVERDMRVEAMK